MKGQYWKKSKNLLKAACLSAALVTAWGAGTAPPAAATDVQYYVTGSITSTQNLTNEWLVNYNGNSTSSHFYAQQLNVDPTNHTFSTTIWADPNDVQTTAMYTVLALYPGGITAGMSLILPPTVPWNTYFVDINQPWTYDESAVTNFLNANPHSQPNLESFFDTFGVNGTMGVGGVLGSSINLFNFPTGQSGEVAGSAFVESTGPVPVPLPPTLLLMVPSLGVAFLLRRKKEDD